MHPARAPLALLATLALTPACMPPPEPAARPAASQPAAGAAPAAPPAPAAPATGAAPAAPASASYVGHGAASVPPEVLAKYAPRPLPPEVSRRIQAMLDVRAPGGGI